MRLLRASSPWPGRSAEWGLRASWPVAAYGRRHRVQQCVRLASGPNTMVDLSANWRPLTVWTCTPIATVADRLWTASGARCLGICLPWPSPARTHGPSGQVHDRPRQKPVALDELRCDARDRLHTLGKLAGGLATKRSVLQHDRSLSRNFWSKACLFEVEMWVIRVAMRVATKQISPPAVSVRLSRNRWRCLGFGP